MPLKISVFACASSCLRSHLESTFEREMEKRRERKKLCDFHFQVLNVKDQGCCLCLLNVKECDSKRGGEVRGQGDDKDADSNERESKAVGRQSKENLLLIRVLFCAPSKNSGGPHQKDSDKMREGGICVGSTYTRPLRG